MALAARMICSAVFRLTPHSAARSAADGRAPERRSARTRANRSSPAYGCGLAGAPGVPGAAGPGGRRDLCRGAVRSAAFGAGLSAAVSLPADGRPGVDLGSRTSSPSLQAEPTRLGRITIRRKSASAVSDVIFQLGYIRAPAPKYSHYGFGCKWRVSLFLIPVSVLLPQRTKSGPGSSGRNRRPLAK
jgi:hypothetical protein